MLELDGHVKWITTHKLIEVLGAAPENARLLPNTVGNLVAYAGNDDDGWYMVGYVDIASEEYIPIEEDEWPSPSPSESP